MRVFRLVGNEEPTVDDFASKAARGLICPNGTDSCSWASCSLFKDARTLLKYTRLRSELPYLVTLHIPSGVGVHKVGGKRGHVDFWRYNGSCLTECVVAVEGPHNDA